MDFSILKPVDGKVKRGDNVISDSVTNYGRRVKIVAGPNDFSEFCTEDCRGEYFVIKGNCLYYAPLGWVDNRPIYPDSILFIGNKQFKIDTENHLEAALLSGKLSWNHTPIYKTGWLNVYPSERAEAKIYVTEKDANLNAYTHRVACIEICWKE